ncbi:programmed cell death protein 2 [Camillea tinctor]|nr:programmed cell death protein 2 [Camillea tinctor]
MPPYDSDSSEGEGEDFTETNVLLGYASKDPEDDSITRLGGQPDWLDESSPPSAALARCKICKDIMVLLLQLNGELPDRFPGHERRLYIFACRKKGCRRREGSIRALRGVRVAKEATTSLPHKPSQKNGSSSSADDKPQGPTKPAPPSNLGETLFGAQTLGGPSGSANPFSTNPFSTTASGSNPFASTNNPAANPFSSGNNTTSSPPPAPPAEDPKPSPSPPSEVKSLPQTFAAALSLNTPPSSSPSPPAPEPWPPSPSLPAPYPISYLSEAEYETLDAGPPAVSQNTVQTDVDTNSDGKAGGGKEDREVFESTMDATFQRFADRVSQNPEQCIRYEFGGAPLLYSRADAVGMRFSASPSSNNDLSSNARSSSGDGMPPCASCGGPRAFEVQLMPRAILELEAEELSLEGMEWGTVVVGVCARDCLGAESGVVRGGDGSRTAYVEEWAGVQWEEVGAPGKGR